MPIVHGRADGVADGLEIVTFQKMDLRLDQAAAFKFDPAQGHDKGIIRGSLDGQQGGGPDGAVRGVPEGRNVDRRGKPVIGNA